MDNGLATNRTWYKVAASRKLRTTVRQNAPSLRQAADEVFWRKDGTSFPVEYMSTPIGEGGEVIGAVVTFSDITEQNLSPIFEVDPTGAVTYLNAAAREGVPELVGSGSRHPVLAGVAGAAGAMRAKRRSSLVSR